MNLLVLLALLMKMVSNYSETRYQHHVCVLVQHTVVWEKFAIKIFSSMV